MNIISKVITALNSKIRNLEDRAHDVLELPNDLKALRVDDDVYIVDYNKGKIVEKMKDTYPSNPARAMIQIMKKMKVLSYADYRNAIDKKSVVENEKNIWTCGFRQDEERWVWYLNSEPKMTVSFKEANPNINFKDGMDVIADSLNKKVEFCSAKFGTSIIEKIKKNGYKEVAQKMNALVLENPYIEIMCKQCSVKDNYTIDDLVDENKNAKYDAQHVLCSNCNELIKLINQSE